MLESDLSVGCPIPVPSPHSQGSPSLALGLSLAKAAMPPQIVVSTVTAVSIVSVYITTFSFRIIIGECRLFQKRISRRLCALSGSVGMVKSVFIQEYAAFFSVLRAERKKAGVTQVELARRLGITQSAVSKIERGERGLDVVEFVSLVRALRADPPEVIATVERAFPKSRRGKRRR
jgi:DNA-binding XRE family transcriptional regulator